MTMMFAADLWQKPDGWEPIAITHDDPDVMQIARALLNANPEYRNSKPTPWDYQVRGATQGHDYYEAPYRSTIAEHIDMAIAVLAVIGDRLLPSVKGCTSIHAGWLPTMDDAPIRWEGAVDTPEALAASVAIADTPANAIRAAIDAMTPTTTRRAARHGATP